MNNHTFIASIAIDYRLAQHTFGRMQKVFPRFMMFYRPIKGSVIGREVIGEKNVREVLGRVPADAVEIGCYDDKSDMEQFLVDLRETMEGS